jgi:hypothetical protein
VHIPVAVITDPVVYDETLGAAGVHALASQLAVAKGVTVRVSNVDVMAFAVAYDASAERLGDALAPSSGLDAYWEFGCDALSDKLTCSERMLPQTLCSDVTVEPATPGKPAQTKAVCADAGVFVSTCTVEDCGGVEPATCDDTGVSEQLGHEFAEFDLLTNLQATLYPYASGAARADVPGVGGALESLKAHVELTNVWLSDAREHCATDDVTAADVSMAMARAEVLEAWRAFYAAGQPTVTAMFPQAERFYVGAAVVRAEDVVLAGPATGAAAEAAAAREVPEGFPARPGVVGRWVDVDELQLAQFLVADGDFDLEGQLGSSNAVTLYDGPPVTIRNARILVDNLVVGGPITATQMRVLSYGTDDGSSGGSRWGFGGSAYGVGCFVHCGMNPIPGLRADVGLSADCLQRLLDGTAFAPPLESVDPLLGPTPQGWWREVQSNPMGTGFLRAPLALDAIAGRVADVLALIPTLLRRRRQVRSEKTQIHSVD